MNSNFLSRINPFYYLSPLIRSARIRSFLIIAIIGTAIPITVLVAQRQQEIRQHASGFNIEQCKVDCLNTSCGGNDPESVPECYANCSTDCLNKASAYQVPTSTLTQPPRQPLNAPRIPTLTSPSISTAIPTAIIIPTIPLIPSPPASSQTFTISGTVFIDLNNNGQLDSGEPTYANPKLTLEENSTTGDPNGKYSFAVNISKCTNGPILSSPHQAYHISTSPYPDAYKCISPYNSTNPIFDIGLASDTYPTQTPTDTQASITPVPSPTPQLPPPSNPSTAPVTLSCSLRNKGDANCDNKINNSDFDVWRDEFISELAGITTERHSDFNNDSVINIVDFNIWKTGFSDSSLSH